MGRLLGYMRISTLKQDQKFDRQEAQLSHCDKLYSDRISGAKRQRPQLDQLLSDLQKGDTVLILSIDRLSRSTKDLLEIVEIITAKGAQLKSIQDTWLDTSSENPMSEFLLTIMGALGQMERKMIQKRVQEGVKVAQSKGAKFGRPKTKNSKVAHALKLYDEGNHTGKEIAEICNISKRTLYNYVKQRELEQEEA